MSIKAFHFLTWGDKVLISILIIVNVSLLFLIGAGGKKNKVMIDVDQKHVGIYDLESPQRIITIEGALGPSEIEIRDGKVRMRSSPCPHKNCLKTGWIDHQGQIICCVPNKVFIHITGGEDTSFLQLDGVSR